MNKCREMLWNWWCSQSPLRINTYLFFHEVACLV